MVMVIAGAVMAQSLASGQPSSPVVQYAYPLGFTSPMALLMGHRYHKSNSHSGRCQEYITI